MKRRIASRVEVLGLLWVGPLSHLEAVLLIDNDLCGYRPPTMARACRVCGVLEAWQASVTSPIGNE